MSTPRSLAAAWPTVHSGRAELVERFQERMVRRSSWSLSDPWALLPAGRAVVWRGALAGRLLTARFVLAGMLARRRALPVALALVALVFLALWAGLAPALGVPITGAGAAALVVAAAAVVRTVTRPALDFADLGIVSVLGLLVPAGLVLQVLPGPDLLVVALVLLSAGVVAAVPVSLVLSAAATFRTGSLVTRSR